MSHYLNFYILHKNFKTAYALKSIYLNFTRKSGATAFDNDQPYKILN